MPSSLKGERTEGRPELPVLRLLSQVVGASLCAVCGTCVAVCPEGCLEAGDESPVYLGGCSSCMACVECCSGKELPMPELERHLFGRVRGDEEHLGVYDSAHVGHAVEPHVRRAGTSGGVVTALLTALLHEERVTAALCTVFDEDLPYRPVAAILRDPDAILAAAQSKYALTPQLAALPKARPGDRLAVVGLPCQIAGLRKVSLAGRLRVEVAVTVGLFCLSGFHLDATRFIVEEVMGLSLHDGTSLEYRHGSFPGSPSVTTKTGERRSIPYSEAKQHLRMFRPYRCMVCCDWSAELADLSAGDLWSDPSRRGYTSLLVRTRPGAEALRVAERSGAVYMEPADGALIAQNPGFYYKKHANAVFLREARAHGLPCPTYP